MAQLKIGIIVGSLRTESFNRKLANALMKLAPADVSIRRRGSLLHECDRHLDKMQHLCRNRADQ